MILNIKTPSSEDRFKFGAPVFATVAVVLTVTIALSMASPWSLLVLALVAMAVLLAVWFRAGIRTGRWVWLDPRGALNPVEGLTWVSAAVILVPIIALTFFGSSVVSLAGLEVTYGAFDEGPLRDERATHYSDSGMQQRLKRALETSNIPHRVYTRDGKEWIAWSRQHEDVVQKIQKERVMNAVPSGRNVSFGSPEEQQRFIDWLIDQKIGYEVVMYGDKPVVVWAEAGDDVLERFARHQLIDCHREAVDKAKKATKKPRC